MNQIEWLPLNFDNYHEAAEILRARPSALYYLLGERRHKLPASLIDWFIYRVFIHAATPLALKIIRENHMVDIFEPRKWIENIDGGEPWRVEVQSSGTHWLARRYVKLPTGQNAALFYQAPVSSAASHMTIGLFERSIVWDREVYVYLWHKSANWKKGEFHFALAALLDMWQACDARALQMWEAACYPPEFRQGWILP